MKAGLFKSLKALSGADALGSIAKTGLAPAWSGLSAVGALLLSLASRGGADKQITTASNPAERFIEAAAHYGLDEIGLRQKLKESCVAFYVYLIAALIFSATAAFNTIPATGWIVVVLVGPLLALFALKSALQNYQIRYRTLTDFSEFAKSGDYLPHLKFK